MNSNVSKAKEALWLDPSWPRAETKARELVKALKSIEAQCRITITRREGRRPGWRVVVQRCLDSVTSTAFVPDVV